MKIAAADVNKLRKQTGAGMMDCKKALVEAEGDFEAAVDVLRKKGQKIAAKRADRDASEGVATPPYKTYKTPTIIAKKGRTLGRTSNFCFSVGGFLFLSALAESLSMK